MQYAAAATLTRPYFMSPGQDQQTYWLEVQGGGLAVAGVPTSATNPATPTSEEHQACRASYSLGLSASLHSPLWYLPNAFESGQYSFRGWTYGYIQNKEYTVYANKGQIADIKLNLIIGVNVTIDILFKKEHVITGTEANMSARVRLFDDSGELLATWMSSEGVNVTSTGRATAADNSRFTRGVVRL